MLGAADPPADCQPSETGLLPLLAKHYGSKSLSETPPQAH